MVACYDVVKAEDYVYPPALFDDSVGIDHGQATESNPLRDYRKHKNMEMLSSVVSRQIGINQAQGQLVNSISRMMSSDGHKRVNDLISFPFDIRDETENVHKEVHTFVPGPESNTFYASKVIKDSIETDGLMPDMAYLRGGAHLETNDKYKKGITVTGDRRSTQDFGVIDFLRGLIGLIIPG